MKLYVHFCAFGFSNCYILGTNESPPPDPGDAAAVQKKMPPNEAIIIDPGDLDEAVIKNIEDNEYTLKGVLITHNHLNHVHGLSTLKRIYKTEIYCINPVIKEYKTKPIRDGDVLKLGSIKVEVIAAPGHSADSAIFKAGRMLFTGDALSAGLVGTTSSVYAAANQMNALRGKILSLPGDYTILPGHGPPSSLEAERRFNAGINTYENYKTRRSRLRPELD